MHVLDGLLFRVWAVFAVGDRKGSGDYYLPFAVSGYATTSYY